MKLRKLANIFFKWLLLVFLIARTGRRVVIYTLNRGKAFAASRPVYRISKSVS